MFRENFDCQFISRGEQLEILGEAAEVKMAATLVEELQYLYRQGTTITMHEVRYGIGLVRGGKGEALHTLFGDTILVTARAATYARRRSASASISTRSATIPSRSASGRPARARHTWLSSWLSRPCATRRCGASS